MGRELRRKQAKRDGKSLEREEIVEENQIKKYLITIFIVVAIIGLIYLISELFITKNLKWFSKEETNTSEKTVANIILASAIFRQSEEEYYVYFYDFDEEEKDSAITNLVNNKLTSDKVYKVNTKSALNANYVGEESNKKAKKLEELKVVAPTLIKISGDSIKEYYEKDEIKKKLS